MNIVLYQPDIPQNAGSFVRLCACLGATLHVIGPCGFIWDDKKLKRVAMDYDTQGRIVHHTSWHSFLATIEQGRILLLTTKSAEPYTQMQFQPGDYLLLGRESSGVPEEVHARADARITIPMQQGARSLNVVLAAAMVAGEALRQTRWNT